MAGVGRGGKLIADSVVGMATLTPQAFAKKWTEAALSEGASYQQRFVDLSSIIWVPTGRDGKIQGCGRCRYSITYHPWTGDSHRLCGPYQ